MRKLLSAIEYWDFIYKSGLPDYSVLGYNELFIQFIKQPIQLGFFIPCDKEGKPLDKPELYHDWVKYGFVADNQNEKCFEYQQACDRVLFKGFELLKSYKSIQGEMACELNKEIYFVDNVCFSSYDSVKTIEDISGKVDLVEKVAEKYKY